MVVGDDDVWHGEEGGVHDAGRPGEEEDAPGRLGQRHQHHPARVDQLTNHVHGPGTVREIDETYTGWPIRLITRYC